MGPTEFKRCPQCGRTYSLNSQSCVCGHVFQTQFAQPPPGIPYVPPQSGYPGPQTMAFTAYGQPVNGQMLEDMARRHRDSHVLMTWTLVVGLLCLWPLLIVSYLEYNKMRDIKNEIVRMGVDLNWWQMSFRTK